VRGRAGRRRLRLAHEAVARRRRVAAGGPEALPVAPLHHTAPAGLVALSVKVSGQGWEIAI